MTGGARWPVLVVSSPFGSKNRGARSTRQRHRAQPGVVDRDLELLALDLVPVVDLVESAAPAGGDAGLGQQEQEVPAGKWWRTPAPAQPRAPNGCGPGRRSSRSVDRRRPDRRRRTAASRAEGCLQPAVRHRRHIGTCRRARSTGGDCPRLAGPPRGSENGIEHLLTQPRSPTTTGKIERFHRALRTEFRTDRVFTDLAAAQARARRVGRRLQPRPAAPGAGHGHPRRTVPAQRRRRRL